MVFGSQSPLIHRELLAAETAKAAANSGPEHDELVVCVDLDSSVHRGLFCILPQEDVAVVDPEGIHSDVQVENVVLAIAINIRVDPERAEGCVPEVVVQVLLALEYLSQYIVFTTARLELAESIANEADANLAPARLVVNPAFV